MKRTARNTRRHLWALLLCILGAAMTSSAQAMERTQLYDLFSEAKGLFREASDAMATDPEAAKELYRRAAMRFEAIVEKGGVRNGRLHYNIGNAYFRMGDLGRAILHYRRAGLYIPNDPLLRQNLAYARSRRTDNIPPRQETRVLETLFFWHYDLAARTRLTLFAVVSGLTWALAIVRLLRRSAPPRWCIVLAAMVAALLLGSLLAEGIAAARHRAGVVVAAEVIARKGDAETYQPSFKEPLHAGTEFDLVETRGDWAHVELADGRRCWLPVKAIGLVK